MPPKKQSQQAPPRPEPEPQSKLHAATSMQIQQLNASLQSTRMEIMAALDRKDVAACNALKNSELEILSDLQIAMGKQVEILTLDLREARLHVTTALGERDGHIADLGALKKRSGAQQQEAAALKQKLQEAEALASGQEALASGLRDQLKEVEARERSLQQQLDLRTSQLDAAQQQRAEPEQESSPKLPPGLSRDLQEAQLEARP